MARFLGSSLALAGFLLIALVITGEFLAPEPIIHTHSGGQVPIPTRTDPATP
jgi:hypothetical protein